MPAPRKYPDELRRRAIRLTPGRPGRPGPVQGVFQARGRRAGGRPRDPARPGSARGFGSVAGDRPGTTTEEARRTGELEKEVRGPGAGGAIGRSASACPWRRSSTARPADLPVHRPAQGGVRGRADLHRPDRVRVQDRPVHLLRRPQQAALQEVDLGRRPGREDPRPGGPSRSTRRWDPGRPGGCSTPGRRAPGWPAAPRERRMRAPESDRRRAGQDGAHHRARQGEPGPRSARCAATSPPPAQTGAGWSTSPTCRPGRGSATPPSSWTCSPAGSSAGPPAAAWTPTTRSAPWSRRSGRARTAGAATSRARSTTATTDLSTCPSPTPDDSSTRAPVASAGAVGSSYDNAAAEALGKSYKRELVWRDGPWKDRDDLETATAQWVNWYNRTRPHRANPDDLSPAAAEHRYHRNHTTPAAAPATA